MADPLARRLGSVVRRYEVSHAGEGASQNPLSVARPEGVEPPTDGSEVRRGVVEFRGDTRARDSLVSLASGFLIAAARGESSAEARRGLVIAAVEAGASGPVVARALAEGPGSHAAAVDLAATILDGRTSASVDSRARGGT